MLKPTTILLGEKANKLLHEMAAENGIATRYFYTKLITREARTRATTLSGEKLKNRLRLIDEVEDELSSIINNPPKVAIYDRDYSLNPHSIYCKIWQAHKRLEKQGKTPEEIHQYCIDRYGMDQGIATMPQKDPRRNPDWTGGGPVAQKIKKAKEVSRKIEVQ